jgi:hypothetical protein
MAKASFYIARRARPDRFTSALLELGPDHCFWTTERVATRFTGNNPNTLSSEKDASKRGDPPAESNHRIRDGRSAASDRDGHGFGAIVCCPFRALRAVGVEIQRGVNDRCIRREACPDEQTKG